VCGSMPHPQKTKLIYHLGHTARANGPASLANGKSQPLLHRDWLAQFHRDRHAIPGHHHLDVVLEGQ